MKARQAGLFLCVIQNQACPESNGMLIEPGSSAPDIRLPDQHGKTVRLSDFRGRVVVLYFYPEDGTPSCTNEACDFRDHLPRFASSDAVVLGVSPDGVDSHRAFINKHSLGFTLLADVPPAEGASPPICDAYGVWQQKSMYGRTYMGVVRTTYLIDRDGNVARRWDRVRVKGHAEEVLEAARALASGGADAPGTQAAAASKNRAASSARRPAAKKKPAAKKVPTTTKQPVKKVAASRAHVPKQKAASRPAKKAAPKRG